MCGGCHGENGIPQEKTTPVIWGQHQGYLYLQLRDYKRGDRKNDQMSPIARPARTRRHDGAGGILLQEDVAESGQPPAPRGRRRRAPARQRLGRLHRLSSGDLSGRRHAAAPRRPAKDYLLQSMLDFRTGKRGNNPGMSDLMKATSEEDHHGAGGISGGAAATRRAVTDVARGNLFLRRAASRAAPSFAAGRAAVFPLLVLQRAVRRRGASNSVDDRRVAELGRDHQRRAAAVVGSIDVRAAIQHERDDVLGVGAPASSDSPPPTSTRSDRCRSGH